MGRTWKCGNVEIVVPQGVEVRAFSDGRAPLIGLRFKYRGVMCREWSLSASNPKAAAHNVALAGAKVTEVRDLIERGKFVYGEHFAGSKRCALFGEVSTKGLRVKDLLDRYETWVGKRVAKTTARTYKLHLARYVRPSWDSRPVEMLLRANLKAFIEELAEGGQRYPILNRKREVIGEGVTGPLVLSSGRAILAPFMGAMDLAVGDGKLKHSPFADIDLSTEWPLKQRATDYEPDPFNEKERVAIMAVATRSWRLMLSAWFYGGYRPSELIALKWPEVDFQRERVHVCRINSLAEIEERTKTAHGTRHVPMLDPARAALKEQRELTGLKPHGFVFENAHTGRPWNEPDSLSWQFEALLKRAKVRYRPIKHCRHTFASIMLANGEDLGTLSEMMGHAHPGVTLKFYARMIKEEKAGAKHGFALRGDYSKVAA